MSKIINILVFLIIGATTSQAAEQNVVIDLKSSKPGAARAYSTDLSECKKLAAQVYGDGTKEALLGMMAGAMLGATVGRAFGGPDYIAYGATQGAAVGLTKGVVRGEREQTRRTETALDRCMTARGYTVIGIGQMLADQYVPIKFVGGVILAPSIPASSPVLGYADSDTDENQRTVAVEVAIYEECEWRAVSERFSSATQWDQCLDQRGSIQPRSAEIMRQYGRQQLKRPEREER